MIGPVSAGSSTDIDKILQILEHVSNPARLAKTLSEIRENLVALSQREDTVSGNEIAISAREAKLEKDLEKLSKDMAEAKALAAKHEAGLAEVASMRVAAQALLEGHQKSAKEFEASVEAHAVEMKKAVDAFQAAVAALEVEKASVAAMKSEYEERHAKLRAAMGG